MEGDCWTADADNLIMAGTGQQRVGFMSTQMRKFRIKNANDKFIELILPSEVYAVMR